MTVELAALPQFPFPNYADLMIRVNLRIEGGSERRQVPPLDCFGLIARRRRA
jgi:hypothetical protein